MPFAQRRHRRLLTIAIVVAAAGWLTAKIPGGEDDRGQIIVRSGSLIIESGTVATPGPAWAKDSHLGEWKPTDADFKGISGFEVTFADPYGPLTCSPPLFDNEVRIEYTRGDGSLAKMKLRRRFKNLFGKPEPKVDPDGLTLTDVTGATPPQLRLEDTGGYISKIIVGLAVCRFDPPASPAARANFRIIVQPKADH
jgi:hypothetical protein